MRTPGTAVIFLTLAVACAGGKPAAGQEPGQAGRVVDVSQLPKQVVAGENKVSLFVDWEGIQEVEGENSSVPYHSTSMYTVNRTAKPVTIRRTSYFDGNSALEFFNQEEKRWQRTFPRHVQWGACGTGEWEKEISLQTGQCFVEPVLLQKFGEVETIRYRLHADGEDYYSNAHALQVFISPLMAKLAEQDDWTIAYGSTALLEKLATGKIEFPRSPHPFVKAGLSESRLFAIQCLAQPWHSPEEVIPVLDAVIEEKGGQAEDYAKVARQSKKTIQERASKKKANAKPEAKAKAKGEGNAVPAAGPDEEK